MDRGWFPIWFPRSAHNINASQTTFDSNFIWIDFLYDSTDDFLKNCLEKSSTEIEKPPAKFMERFSSSTQESYQQLLNANAKLYECSDKGTKFYVAAGSAEQKAYMWTKDW